MADEILSFQDLGVGPVDKAVLQETLIETTASALAVAYLALQALYQVCGPRNAVGPATAWRVPRVTST